MAGASLGQAMSTAKGQLGLWTGTESLCDHSGPERKPQAQLGLNVKSCLLVQFIKRPFAYNSYLMCLQYIFTIDKINRGNR